MIVNADVSATAAIAATKIATGVFAGSGATTFPGVLRLAGLANPTIYSFKNAALATATTIDTGVGGFGFVLIMENVTFGGYALVARFPTTLISSGGSGLTWSITAGTASRINVYYDAGGTNTWKIENTTGSTVGVVGFIVTSTA